MPYMLVRHKVVDFDRWKKVFDSHTHLHVAAGMKIQHILRNMEEENEVVFLFELEDIEKAKAFVYGDEVPDAQEEAGVADEPDIYFLS